MSVDRTTGAGDEARVQHRGGERGAALEPLHEQHVRTSQQDGPGTARRRALSGSGECSFVLTLSLAEDDRLVVSYHIVVHHKWFVRMKNIRLKSGTRFSVK